MAETRTTVAARREDVFEQLWWDALDNASTEVPAHVRGDARENLIFVGAVLQADGHAEAAKVSVDDFRKFIVKHVGFTTWPELTAHCASWMEQESSDDDRR